jgi:ferredoxin
MTGTAADKRLLIVDEERCIGCRACSSVCPVDLIALTDGEGERILTFPVVCGEDCQQCAQVCPEEAISLTFVKTSPPEERFDLSFDMVYCHRCGSPFITEGEMMRLKATIPQEMQTDALGRSWLELCPRCRRSVEREKAARETIASRGLKHR